MFKFEIPAHEKSIIKVIGVGGGGSNAVNHMFSLGIKGVEFVICNTDMQALKSSPVTTKLQIGQNLTEGLGAGADPDKGRRAALESKEQIRELLSKDTKMVFITAGMGGGTGTGAAPVIAEISKDLGILTVGIVTAPFSFEGKKKKEYAEKGISEMKNFCDTVLVVLNDKLREVYGDIKFSEAFAKADNVLTEAAKSIAEIITVHSKVNVDFMDVNTVMKNSGAAVMGTATASGKDRARIAAEGALNSPLLNDANVKGAKKVLVSISYSEQFEPTMDELGEITDYIQEQIGLEPEMLIPGYGTDNSLGENIRITVIATGFEEKEFDQTPKYFHLEKDTQQPINTPPVVEKKTDYSQQSLFSLHLSEKRAEEPQMPPVANIRRVPLFEDGLEAQAIHEATTGKFEVKSEYKERDEKLEERRSRLSKLSINPLNDNDIKDKLERPAYERRQVKLDETPHSSEREISRFRLNDDNEILGDNRFLHDNVD